MNIDIIAHDEKYGIHNVDIYINDILIKSDKNYPYTHELNTEGFGFYSIRANAYDLMGNSRSTSIYFLKLS
jgi:hypothetical protein